MMNELRPAFVVFLALTIVTGAVYPAIVTVVGRVAFADQVSGSVIERDGRAIGSRLLGQPFSAPEYFWSRPSATSPMPYNGAVSSGSNQGPTNPSLASAVEKRIAALHAADPENTGPVPVDLVTASGERARPSHIHRRCRVPTNACRGCARVGCSRRRNARAAAHARTNVRDPRRAACECARAQSRARCAPS